MRSNIVSEASLRTRVSQWWTAVPFVTSAIVILCGVIYAVCLLIGYDSFFQVCFLPSAVTSNYEVYRIFTSTLFHVSILHLVFNMMALVPIGSALERILGSVRYTHVLLLIATFNGVLHMLFALLAAHNPVHLSAYFMNECSVGFSGMIFALIVMESNLSGVQSRSIFGLFTVPAKWYAWILLVLFQLLMPNVSLLGHLCGILSGFAYVHGLFNPFLFGSSTYAAMESSWIMASFVRRPGFIIGGGMPTTNTLPTISPSSSNASLSSLWRGMRSWVPQREPTTDERFPGRGRTLSSMVSTNRPISEADSGLQTRLLEREAPNGADSELVMAPRETSTTPNTRPVPDMENVADSVSNLVAMGFEQKQAEVALHAAKGDLALAVEFLSSQQVP